MKSMCVFCGSSDSVHSDYLSAAWSMGKVLAERGFAVIYGGGKTGLMGAVADGALSAGGEVIGVIIPSMNTKALAHDGLTRMDVTPSMHARKARMHELADAYIAMPGGFGTFDELFETITWAQTGAHEKPVGILNVKNYFDPCLPPLTMQLTRALSLQNIVRRYPANLIPINYWIQWRSMNIRMKL